jgi:hypothetical protein
MSLMLLFFKGTAPHTFSSMEKISSCVSFDYLKMNQKKKGLERAAYTVSLTWRVRIPERHTTYCLPAARSEAEETQIRQLYNKVATPCGSFYSLVGAGPLTRF